MRLAIFDIDNTLIAGDSDLLWGEFLCERNYIESKTYKAAHKKYYQDYLKGNLDINDFLIGMNLRYNLVSFLHI